MAPRLLPDYEQVVKLLTDLNAVGTQVAGTGSCTTAKDQAKGAAGAAAKRVVKSLPHLQLTYCRTKLARKQVVAAPRQALDTATYRPLAGTPCGRGSALRTRGCQLAGQLRTALQALAARLDRLGEENQLKLTTAGCTQARQAARLYPARRSRCPAGKWSRRS